MKNGSFIRLTEGLLYSKLRERLGNNLPFYKRAYAKLSPVNTIIHRQIFVFCYLTFVVRINKI
jgi:hypothetical protein